MLLRSLAYLYLSAFFLISACAVSTQITNTPRSSFEQRLLVRALERAIAGLDAQQFKGKTAAIDFFGLTADKDFAKEFVTAWFQSQGVRIATNGGQAQLHLKVFASALAVDQGHFWHAVFYRSADRFRHARDSVVQRHTTQRLC